MQPNAFPLGNTDGIMRSLLQNVQAVQRNPGSNREQTGKAKLGKCDLYGARGQDTATAPPPAASARPRCPATPTVPPVPCRPIGHGERLGPAARLQPVQRDRDENDPVSRRARLTEDLRQSDMAIRPQGGGCTARKCCWV